MTEAFRPGEVPLIGGHEETVVLQRNGVIEGVEEMLAEIRSQGCGGLVDRRLVRFVELQRVQEINRPRGNVRRKACNDGDDFGEPVGRLQRLHLTVPDPL
jgi:hypothetical protein